MSSRNMHRPITVYGVSHPVFAAPPALAKETVYMPSRLAALVLGRGPAPGVVIREPAAEERRPGETVISRRWSA